MLDEVANQVLEVEQTRAAMNEGYVVDAKRGLQHGHFVELVEHYAGIGIALYVDDDAHAFAVGLVVGVGYAFNLLFIGQVGNVFDEFGLIDSVGNFGDDNFVVSSSAFDFSFCTDDYASTTGKIGFAHSTHAIDIASSGEIGRFDVVHQLFHLDVVVVDIGHAGVNDFREIVRGHVGGHTYSDTRCSVDEQVGYACWHHGGLLQ